MDKEKFAHDNIKLLYAYFHKYKIYDEDEQQDYAYMYWKAICYYFEQGYDKRTTAFSSYLYKALNRLFANKQKAKHALKRTLFEGEVMYSLETPLVKDENYHFSDVVGEYCKDIEQVDCDDVVERLCPQLTPKQARVLQLTYNGYNSAEIGRILGMTKSNANKYQHKTIDFAKRQLWKEMMAD